MKIGAGRDDQARSEPHWRWAATLGQTLDACSNGFCFIGMSDVDELRALIDKMPKPVCAALTPFQIAEADAAAGVVRLEFAEQPAFRNHFGHIQGGFAVAMIDVLLSLAAFAKVRQWLPTVEIKSTFLAPAKLGACIGEGRVLKVGQSLAFVEGRLWGADGALAVHATATALIRPA